MAGRIPSSFIDDLLARVDIVEVVDQRVRLRKQGKDWVACCPFHDEKTPSFTVSASKQLYYCFGCGAGGSVLGFIMDHDNLGFREAVETLAASIGVEVPGGDGRGDDLSPLLQALTEAEQFYRQELRRHREAIDYLKERGISGPTAARYGLGYAPAEWNALLQRGSRSDADTLRRAGLVNRHEASGRYYDRLRGRVVFPIRDRRGHVVAFGGRALDGSQPKYLNTPESAVFHKANELYGLYEARRARRDLRTLVVVEGYMDVVRLAEHGIDYAVATLGTAAGRRHMERLFATVTDVVFCFDGDDAGYRAAWRALEHTLGVLSDGREAHFLFLPRGDDPDTLVAREGVEGFEGRLAEATPLADLFLQRIREGIDTTTIGGRVQVAERARPLLANMPQGLYRELLIDRLATALATTPERLRADLGGEAGSREGAAAAGRAPARPEHVRMTPMRTAIGLIMQNPRLGQLVPCDHAALGDSVKGGALLAELSSRARADPEATTARLLEAYRDRSEYRYLQRLATYRFAVDTSADTEHALEREFRDALDRLHQLAVRGRREALIEAAEQRELSAAEKAELRALMDPGNASDH
jgi:DNA primase